MAFFKSKTNFQDIVAFSMEASDEDFLRILGIMVTYQAVVVDTLSGSYRLPVEERSVDVVRAKYKDSYFVYNDFGYNITERSILEKDYVLKDGESLASTDYMAQMQAKSALSLRRQVS